MGVGVLELQVDTMRDFFGILDVFKDSHTVRSDCSSSREPKFL